MKKKHLITIASAITLISCLISCESKTTSYERGNDPWVVRSVLDEQPRMLTLALSPDFWMAYSAENASLYRVWKDGVNFDGAVYTTRHGPQPDSRGNSYIENTEDTPWLIIKDGTTSQPKVQYKGHAFEKEQVTLSYTLEFEGTIITIEETPEFVPTQDGKPTLVRIFETKNVPQGVTVGLKSKIGTITSEKDYTTTGKFVVENKADRTLEGGGIVQEISGILELNSNENTKISIVFDAKAADGGIDEVITDFSPTALIERSDCNACHNVTEKTVGPSFTEVGIKYPNSLKSIEYLAKKIIEGGTGIWGPAAMTPHPDMSYDNAAQIAEYILSLDTEEKVETSNENQGVIITAYQFAKSLTKIPKLDKNSVPVFSRTIANARVESKQMDQMTQGFLTVITGNIKIERTTNYLFQTRTTFGGSRFILNGRKLLDFDGVHDGSWIASPEVEIELEAGIYPFRYEYFKGKPDLNDHKKQTWSVLRWKPYGQERFRDIPKNLLSYDDSDIITETKKAMKGYKGPEIPGDALPLNAVHPAFDLSQARPDSFKPRIGGMDFMKDGSLIVCTWDSIGAVYRLRGLEHNDPEKITVTRVAEGLAEPLGIKVVDGDIYVIQKHELTRLIDKDKDGIIDVYQTVCNGWKVSSNFHEFAFGLEYKDGYFYIALATAIEPGGASTQPQISDRGKVFKINKDDGLFELIAHGLRTPNGMGFGTDGELFNADNQGDWLPASKVVHIQKDAWYGSRSVDFEGTADLKETLPVVWMPQNEIGNSPSQPGLLNIGPYQNQMMVGEVTHGGIKRIFVEKVNGAYQGGVFRFVQGLEAGVNRFVWGPDGDLYVGGIGVAGNWGHYANGKLGESGLQKLHYNGTSVFEMLSVKAKSNGIEIEFTEPLKEGEGIEADDYLIKQWWYKPTKRYGGPKMDEEVLNIASVNVSEGRRKVFLELEGMKSEHVVYIRINNALTSSEDHELWSTECWYTMNNIPENNPGFSRIVPAIPDNTLTEAEKAAGWKLLFDGKTTQGWRKFKGEKVGASWKAQNGTLALIGAKKGKHFVNGGDIITEGEFENYELSIEWKISTGGNSGIIYNVSEADEFNNVWKSGPEMQVLDNGAHPDAQINKHRAGDLYDMISCKYETVKIAGEWNKARLIVNNGKVEHWLNGKKVVAFEMFNDAWKKMISESKFNKYPGFGTIRRGHIALQDHNDEVWYKNIKIREL